MFNPFDVAKRAAEDAGKAIADASQDVAGAAGEVWDGASNAVGGAVDATGHAVGDAADSAANAVGDAVDVAGHAVGDAANVVGGAVNAVTGAVTQTAVGTRECVEAVVGAVGGAAGSVFGLMGKVGGSVAGLFHPEMDASDIERVVKRASRMAGARVERSDFLKGSFETGLRRPGWRLVGRGPLGAGFPESEVALVASKVVSREAAEVPRLTPDDARMVSAKEWARYYVSVLRAIQKLCYLYGWGDVFEFEMDGLSQRSFRLVVLMVDQMRAEPIATETLVDIAKGYSSASEGVVGEYLDEQAVGEVVDAVCDSISFGMNLESYYQVFALGNGEQPESLGYLDFRTMVERLRAFLEGTVLARGEREQPEWVRQRLDRKDWLMTLAGLSSQMESPTEGENVRQCYERLYLDDDDLG